MIREATAADVPRIVELGSRSLREGPYRDQLDNPEQSARLALEMIAGKGSVLVSDEQGVCGLFASFLHQHYFTGRSTATELMWYVEPEHRKGGTGLRLLEAAEKLNRSLGAERMQITAPSLEIGEMYRRCGYHFLEVGYERVL